MKQNTMTLLKNWKIIELKLKQFENHEIADVSLRICDELGCVNICQLKHVFEAFSFGLDLLQENEYAILKYYYYDSLSVNQIIDHLFISKATFYRLRKQAIQKVETAVDGLGGDVL